MGKKIILISIKQLPIHLQQELKEKKILKNNPENLLKYVYDDGLNKKFNSFDSMSDLFIFIIIIIFI